MSKWLSKSDYLKFLIAPAWLWLKKHDPDKLPAFDEVGQHFVDQGNEVEAYARQLFPEAKLVEAEIFDQADETKKLIDGGAKVLLQGAVLTNRNLYAAADVLKSADETWEIYEVKSGTKDKREYIDDLAFQKVAFEEAGYPISSTYLILVDRQYERSGAVDPDKLLKIVEVTDQVDPLLKVTKDRIKKALAVVASETRPDDSLLGVYQTGRWLEIYRHLYPKLSDDHIYNLCWLNPGLVKKLDKLGIKSLNDIPANFALNPRQRSQVETFRAGEPHIHPLKIAHQLNKLKFPLYFLDYETAGSAVPLWDGIRPYDSVPFQYSLDILHEDGKLDHREFLATGSDNPMPALLKQLKRDLGDTGSVVVWHSGFEKGCHDYMAEHYPQYKDYLKGVNKRVYDLKMPFADGYYVDHRFRGSASIKDVLPVLVPELNYKVLAIGEGNTASLRWVNCANGKTTGAEADKVYKDLLVYCGQDTMAMVKIYQFLAKLIEPTKTEALPF